ncbi:MAG: DNA-binding response regulator [Epulopiscium sp. Nuni2H_MBin001]|nr:MAG: DNA-binding response regulator [Epulopiscium sp. Nuni2H_MBin001]
MKYNVLAIDDEIHILELLKYNLEATGFCVHCAQTVTDGMRGLEENEIDIILLDVMLPDMDGVTALKNLKQSPYKEIPVIMVTAKVDEIDKIIGLELGADDYICKPFSVRELIARVKVMTRRYKKEDLIKEVSNEIIQFRGLQMDLISHSVSINNEFIEFSLKEFELLKILLENRGRVFTRETLLDRVWGYDYQGETRTVDVHIRYLRGKLEDYKIDNWIETVRGVGYRFIKD